jgi:hypothetical protein
MLTKFVQIEGYKYVRYETETLQHVCEEAKTRMLIQAQFVNTNSVCLCLCWGQMFVAVKY